MAEARATGEDAPAPRGAGMPVPEGTPPAGNKKIAELVPGARYQEIPDARHFPNVEHPDVFNRIMLPWLAKHK